MNQNLKVELNVQGWNIVFKGLDKLEHGEVRLLFDELQKQLQSQFKDLQDQQNFNAPLADKVIR
ncbi:hypothetical protein EBZ38_10415 [bacterium]|nr:hypothetical protein [bacterium]NDD84664.1 hypothetical protein [bacterium]